jgi:hypothetical protein
MDWDSRYKASSALKGVLKGVGVQLCGILAELWGVTVKSATFSLCHISVVPARPGPARGGHRLLPVPSRIGPRCHRDSPCSFLPLATAAPPALRALAGPRGCFGPGCPVQRFTGSSLPSPVPGRTGDPSGPVRSRRLTPAPGSKGAIRVFPSQRRPAGPKVRRCFGVAAGPARSGAAGAYPRRARRPSHSHA